MIGAPRITVVGSLNVDHTFLVSSLPQPGETTIAKSAMTSFGGKGANQAVAAARAGGRVQMIGCVGDDPDGRRYRKHLESEEIGTSGVITASEASTGSAFITVDQEGENCIVVNPGANHAIRVEQVETIASLIAGAAVVLLQLECPLEAVARAAELGREAGAMVLFNPSPWDEAVKARTIPADLVVVNESEARALTGWESGSLRGEAGSVLEAAGCEALIVTRGAEPTLVISAKEEFFEVCPPAVEPVDTVGAGDTFAGALAVAVGGGANLRKAVEFANCAAAMATLQAGAQAAIPTQAQILEWGRTPG